MYRFDNGFAFHHWLLARLPWHRIITISSATQNRKVWIVSLGHGMEDPHLNQLLRRYFPDPKLSKSKRLRFLWVIPSALQRAQEAHEKGEEFDPAGPRYWHEWMGSCLEDEGIAGPFPALAHEFVYDLWSVFRRG